jgi:hypothetical protein
MHPMISNKGMLAKLGIVSLLCAVCAPNAWLRATPENGKAIEVTQTDLFSLPDWQSKSIAVNGFILGVTKLQATQIAQAHGLTLLTHTSLGSGVGPCHQEDGVRNVYKVDGPWIGMDLSFDHDRLIKISVMVADDAVPEVKKVSVARQFKGLTYKLFNHYSDGFRKQILGPTEGKEMPYDNIPNSPYRFVEYEYPHAGITVRVTINKADSPPEPFDIQVDFVAPRKN